MAPRTPKKFKSEPKFISPPKVGTPRKLKSQGYKTGPEYERLVQKVLLFNANGDYSPVFYKGRQVVQPRCTNAGYKKGADITVSGANVEVKFNSDKGPQIFFRVDENGYSFSPKTHPGIASLLQPLLKNVVIFGGKTLPKNITIAEWHQTKENDAIWKDMYIPIPKETYAKLYELLGIDFLQLYQLGKNAKKGLYRISDKVLTDVDMPFFHAEQTFRIQVKVRSSKNAKGFCSLAVVGSCRVKLNTLPDATYSLDSRTKLPPQFTTTS
jgi:hypothetical protein